MSRAEAATLSERQSEFTRGLILDAAVDLLERSPESVAAITFLAVARRAGISQRTVFRYFPTRDEFLDALADRARARMSLPPPPRTLEELLSMPRRLYLAFEAQRRLVAAGLQSELYRRFREKAGPRGAGIRRLVDGLAPGRSERERAIAAANIHYYLGATTWNYYRAYFGLPLEETIACAETAIAQALEGLARS